MVLISQLQLPRPSLSKNGRCILSGKNQGGRLASRGKNLEDYAGFTGAVSDLAVRVSAGSVKVPGTY